MSNDKRKIRKIIGITTAVTGGVFIILKIIRNIKKGNSVYKNEPDQQNIMVGKKVMFVQNDNDPENADGVRGHLEANGEVNYKPNLYNKYLIKAFHVVLSFAELVVLFPIYAVIALAIVIDDPGQVLFTQKRIGQNKEYFKLHKFRSMKMSTPHDVPTHMLKHPEQYITRVGKFLRSHSLDGNVIIRQKPKTSVKSMVSHVSPKHFSKGCNFNFSKNNMHLDDLNILPNVA